MPVGSTVPEFVMIWPVTVPLPDNTLPLPSRNPPAALISPVTVVELPRMAPLVSRIVKVCAELTTTEPAVSNPVSVPFPTVAFPLVTTCADTDAPSIRDVSTPLTVSVELASIFTTSTVPTTAFVAFPTSVTSSVLSPFSIDRMILPVILVSGMVTLLAGVVTSRVKPTEAKPIGNGLTLVSSITRFPPSTDSLSLSLLAARTSVMSKLPKPSSSSFVVAMV
ncbi:hypothetical protein Rcae01_06482 [Novipirellula caenicola]|uniref:Uncharacterized protein n=1 Tax=Novipirellula caenicola TaxID=1536901 RepID=A0ABP9W2F3_9BACT